MSDPYAALEKYEDMLRSLPNVVDLGVGVKKVGGNTVTLIAVKVYVSRKVPKEELAEDERVPIKLDGVLTDVEERSQTDT